LRYRVDASRSLRAKWRASIQRNVEPPQIGGPVVVERVTSYAKLADLTFAHSLPPAVAPQLKLIVIGGPYAGLGIQASSFRHGLAYETADKVEVLRPNGDIVFCTTTHSDLVFGLPNWFGTLPCGAPQIMAEE
jgi:hypothetical protein